MAAAKVASPLNALARWVNGRFEARIIESFS